MRAFLIVWFGQVISLFGSSLTAFALTIWAYQLTERATALALMGFFSFGPTVLLSPVAGALVDRWNRKLVMMLSDLAAGGSSVVIFLLYAAGNLEIWHLYVAGAFAGAFQAFQFPAYSAAITTMLPKEQYARANGMMSLAESASNILAPALAAAIIALIGIEGVLLFDIVTFIFAVSSIAFVHIPQPRETEAGRHGKGSLWKESIYGFRYILARPSLLGLQLMFFQANLFGTMGGTLTNPMILARTGQNELILGTVQSAAAIGGVVSGLLISIWGGPKRRVYGVLGGMIASSLLGQTLMGVGRALPVWAIAGFCTLFFITILNASNQAIWQAKVAPDVQGRVFAIRRLIAQITAPVALLLVGPLADNVFEPAMTTGGALADVFGGLFGTGPGAGMGLLLTTTGLLGALAAGIGFLVPAIRNAETIIPDHDTRSPDAPDASIIAESVAGEGAALLT
jgi:MFS family permease